MAHAFERYRDTAKLIYSCWKKIEARPSAEQLHALCKLTWITKSRDSEANNTGSVVAPAVSTVLGKQMQSWSRVLLEKKIRAMGERAPFARLVRQEIGIVNFRLPYRKSSLEWIRDNRAVVSKAMRLCAEAKNDSQRRTAYELIEDLDTIASPNNGIHCRASNLLTPVFACLDRKERCPIINGRASVQNRLKKLRVSDKPLSDQFDALLAVIDGCGLEGAFALDASSDVPTALVPIEGATLEDADPLTEKDDSDVTVIRKTLTKKQKRLHNRMTTELVRLCKKTSIRIVQGKRAIGLFDAMLMAFPKRGRNMMLEVKTSDDIPVCRMAIGQLIDYQRRLKNRGNIDPVVIFPKRPSSDAAELLAFAKIKAAWFTSGFSSLEGDITI